MKYSGMDDVDDYKTTKANGRVSFLYGHGEVCNEVFADRASDLIIPIERLSACRISLCPANDKLPFPIDLAGSQRSQPLRPIKSRYGTSA